MKIVLIKHLLIFIIVQQVSIFKILKTLYLYWTQVFIFYSLLTRSLIHVHMQLQGYWLLLTYPLFPFLSLLFKAAFCLHILKGHLHVQFEGAILQHFSSLLILKTHLACILKQGAFRDQCKIMYCENAMQKCIGKSQM